MTDVNTNFKPAFNKGHEKEVEIWQVCKKIDKDASLMASKFKDYFGKPSGISTTKADYWMISNIDILLIQTYKLKDFIKANKEYLKRVRGGDNNESQMVLVPIENLNSIGILLDSSGAELELLLSIFIT